jgi:quercetin dioxygenase-like cupin family protein
MHRFLLAGALLLSFAASVAAQEPPKVTPLLSRDLTDIPGKEGTMLIVEYAPGGADPVHRHNAHSFVYVLEGSVVMQVEGGGAGHPSPWSDLL